MIRLASIALSLVVTFGLTATAVDKASATVDPLAIVMRFQDLQFTGDVDGALALFTDDAVVSGRGLCLANPCRGKAAIRPEIARAAAQRTRTVIVSAAVSPGKMETVQASTGDNIRAAGIDRIINRVTFEIKDDKISSLALAPDATDPQTAAFGAFQARQAAAAAQPAAAATTVTTSAPITPPSTGDAGLPATRALR